MTFKVAELVKSFGFAIGCVESLDDFRYGITPELSEDVWR